MVIQYPTHMCGLCYFFLLILIQASSTTIKVIGHIGHNVTLPCMYDVQTHSVLSFCWGQGKVPMSKCSNTILSSPDGAVLSRKSPRYQLLGRVTDGDVSLTILNAQRGDAGVYGCRVEIPGWLNDHKVDAQLTMEEAPAEQPVTENCLLSVAERKEIPTTFEPKTMEVSDMIMEQFQSVREEGIFTASLGGENIGRITAVFFLTVIMIIIFIIWKKVLSRRTPQNFSTHTAENIYESIPVMK
ncbi:T-cell immunoglobulin and mucin domain-containing protein 4-like isoform X2 [Leuresthes tenuis]|uniref:T-cell immunoglobulin and mucin domain-containing protein 4-like isoform X2 n=1 Tax=Leuresthes tenuis TaxID=355514 RepID=UPI003B514B84